MSVPVGGVRRVLQVASLKYGSMIEVFLMGYRIVSIEHPVDDGVDYYGKYLGPNWRQAKFNGKRVPTLISNHGGFLEVLTNMYIRDTPPCFCPMTAALKFYGSFFLKCMQCFPIDRNADSAGLNSQVSAIGERQKMTMETDRDFGALMVFAEGSVTNMRLVSRFRRGAFTSELPV